MAAAIDVVLCGIMFYGAYMGDRFTMLMAVLCLILSAVTSKKKGA